MLAKLALLLQSKVAAAVIGVLVVGGAGTAVAVAANGGRLPFTRPAATGTISTGHQTGQAGDHGQQGQQVSLEGTLKAYDASAATISVLGQNQTTPTTFTVSSATRVNGEHASALADLAKAVGHKVQVQAEKQSDGTLVATKVTVEAADGSQGDGQQPQRSAVAGAITSLGNNAFVVKTWDDKQVTVTVGAQTTFDGPAHSFGDLKVGEPVAAEGTLQADGTLAATRITAGPAGDSSGSAGGQQQGGVSGVIASIGAGSFVVTTPDGKRVGVQVTSATIYWGQAHSFGDLKVGELVAAEGVLQTDGNLAASLVTVHAAASH
jgi:hypothetical protein